MSLEFVSTKPDEQPDLAKFLVSVFGAEPDAPFTRASVLKWKYFEDRRDWPGPRSFLLKQDERMAAHGCVHPVTFLMGGAQVTSMRILDWAGSPECLGSGVLLLRNLACMTETQLAVGGSEQTQEILPKIGFRRQGELHFYAKVLRPWRQYLTRPRNDWKSPLRLVRNSAWSLAPLASAPGWSAEASGPEAVLAADACAYCTPARRTVEMLDYLLRCPAAEMSAYTLFERGVRKGYFVLSRVRGQARIADIAVDSGSPHAWHAAFAIAVRMAAADPQTCEVAAVASTDLVRQAIVANGFRLRRRDPIFLYDPKGLLGKALPLQLNLLDGDEFYLDDPNYPYLT